MRASDSRVIFVDMDYRAQRTRVVRADAKEAELPLPSPPATSIAGARFFIDMPYYLVRLQSGSEVLFELPDGEDVAPLRGRKVLYLDQMAWSRLVRIHSQISTGNAAEDEAGSQIVKMVKDNRLVLPFSGGTLNETSHWTDKEGRQRLGEFVLEFSRGWQMLDSLAIRREEIRRTLLRHAAEEIDPLVPTPWALSPVAIAGLQSSSVEEYDLNSEHPDLVQMRDAMVGTNVVVETLLADTPMPRITRDGWRNHWGQLSAALRHGGAVKENRSKAALFAAFMDAREEVRSVAEEIGYDPRDAAEWLCESAFKDYAEMPAFGLACEVIRLKLMSGANWEMNDLIDVFYFVQAAGYADAVVGERSFTAHIRNAQMRLNRVQTSFRSFGDLLESGLVS